MQESNQGSWQHLVPGDVVMFLSEYMFDKYNIVVNGMLGEIYPDCHSIASYGNEVMAQPVGAKEPFAYPLYMLQKLADVPSEEIVKNALALYEYRFEVFEARVGWTGYVKIKRHIFTEQRIKRELTNTAQLVLKELAHNKEAKVYKGHVKRIKSILNSFYRLPDPSRPLQLAQALSESKFNTKDVCPLLEQARAWSLQPDVPPCIQ